MADVLSAFLKAIAAGDDARAEKAVQALGALGDAALPSLHDLLHDASADCRRWAARALAAVATPAARTLLVAARALSIIRPAEAVPALCAALDDPSAAVAYYAEEALEQMGVGPVLFQP